MTKNLKVALKMQGVYTPAKILRCAQNDKTVVFGQSQYIPVCENDGK